MKENVMSDGYINERDVCLATSRVLSTAVARKEIGNTWIPTKQTKNHWFVKA